MTVQEHIDSLNAIPEVLEAWSEKAPVSIGRAGDLYYVRIIWYYLDGDVSKNDSGELTITQLGVVGAENAVWFGKTPTILVPVVPPEEDPLGDDEAILAALPVRVVKPNIERNKGEATVTGYSIEKGDTATPVRFVVYLDGDTLKVLPTDATVAAADTLALP